MASNSGEYTPQQFRKYNGQSVFKALAAVGKVASANELANVISYNIGEREEDILPEVKQVLRRGITNGFLVRSGKYYSIVPGDLNMQADSGRRRTTRPPKRKAAALKHNTPDPEMDEDEDLSDEEGSEESASEYDDGEPMDPEEMQADSATAYRPIVKLYELYQPPEVAIGDDEESEEDDSEGEDAEEMQTDNVMAPLPKVKLYESYRPPQAGNDNDDDDELPPPKRIRLQPTFKPNTKRN